MILHEEVRSGGKACEGWCIYENSKTALRCAIGVTDWFKTGVGSALRLFLYGVVMDRLTDEVRQKSPWTMMFTDVIYSESREQG